MSDQKISQLSALTEADSDDELAIVDTSATETKKITKANLFGELNDLSDVEIQQLQNIGTETISSSQWGYLGSLDQALATDDSPEFDALTVTSIGGITEGNLLDKSADETITGNWTFNEKLEIKEMAGLAIQGAGDRANTYWIRVREFGTVDNGQRLKLHFSGPNIWPVHMVVTYFQRESTTSVAIGKKEFAFLSRDNGIRDLQSNDIWFYRISSAEIYIEADTGNSYNLFIDNNQFNDERAWIEIRYFSSSAVGGLESVTIEDQPS
jgi:hypothetical protein